MPRQTVELKPASTTVVGRRRLGKLKGLDTARINVVYLMAGQEYFAMPCFLFFSAIDLLIEMGTPTTVQVFICTFPHEEGGSFGSIIHLLRVCAIAQYLGKFPPVIFLYIIV